MRPAHHRLVVAWLGSGLIALGAIEARAAAPVLIDAAEIALREDLAWLADRGRISLGLSTWPVPLGIVERALTRVTEGDLSEADRDALARVRSALARLQGDASVGLRLNTARHPSAGADQVPRARAEAFAQIQAQGDAALPWAGRLRARLQEGRLAQGPSPFGLDGSYVAASVGEAVWSLGAVDRWWGPGRYASVALGDAAAPVPAITLRRGVDEAPSWPWLAWIGPWSYEFSVGRPSHYQPRGSNTLGMRLVARPIDGVEFGLARYIYWGGSGRPRSLGSLGRALIADSNIDDPTVQDDPSNEIAGFDLRVAAPIGPTSWAGYIQVLGEDEAQSAPSKLMMTAGVQLKFATSAMRYEWTLEGSDTRLGRAFGLGSDRQLSAYQHSTYTEGHYHQGLPIGAFIGGGGVVGGIGLVLVPLASANEARHEVRIWSAKVSSTGPEIINAAYGRPDSIRGLLLQTSGLAAAWRWRVGLSVQDGSSPVADRRRAGVVGSLERVIDSR